MRSRTLCRLIAVVGLVSGVTIEASAEVIDPTLVVRGAQSPPGRQSVTIRMTVTPPPAKRTLTTATLTVGPTVVPLEVIVSRTGRVSTRARRLTLAPLPDFGVASLDLAAPIDATVAFAASACVARSHGRILECPGSGAPPTSAPDAVYDADVDRLIGGTPVPIVPALASITTNPNGSRGFDLLLSIYDSLSLDGPTDGSTANLTGYSITGGDIFAVASGTATPSHGPTVARFDGSATSAPFGTPSTWSFTLTRPATGTPAALGGTWVVHFAGGGFMPITGDAILDLTVPSDGHATTAPSELTSGGQTLFAIDAGTCRVAPAGALSCSLPATQYYGAVMHGALDVASGTGSGRFYFGSPPSIYSDGTWTAARP